MPDASGPTSNVRERFGGLRQTRIMKTRHALPDACWWLPSSVGGSVEPASRARAASHYVTSEYGAPHGEAGAFMEDPWIHVNAQVRLEIHDLVRGTSFDDADHAANQLEWTQAKSQPAHHKRSAPAGG